MKLIVMKMARKGGLLDMYRLSSLILTSICVTFLEDSWLSDLKKDTIEGNFCLCVTRIAPLTYPWHGCPWTSGFDLFVAVFP